MTTMHIQRSIVISYILLMLFVQAPLAIREKMKEACTEMSWECGNALRELAQGMKTMTRATRADSHMKNAEAAASHLKSLLQTPIWADADLLDVCPAATVASLLIQIVSCTANITDSVHELATLSKFNNPNAHKPHHHTDVIVILPIERPRDHENVAVIPIHNAER